MKTILCGMMMAVLAGSTGSTAAMGSRPMHEGSASKASDGGSETAIAVPDISLADLKQAMADKAVTLLDCNGSPLSEVRTDQRIGRVLQSGRHEVRQVRHGQGKSRLLRGSQNVIGVRKLGRRQSTPAISTI